MTSSRKRGGSGSEVLGKRRGLLPNIGEYSMEETFDIKGYPLLIRKILYMIYIELL